MPVEGTRVLIVEDNPIHQVVVSAMLRKLGAEVHVVDSGEQAVSVWESEFFDIVLMDVNLPGMSGISATRRIREREALENRQRRTPVVAMTAFITEGEIVTYRECGMTGYIGKPVDEARLVKAIKTWCMR